MQVVKDQVLQFQLESELSVCGQNFFITECRVYMYRSVGIMVAIITARCVDAVPGSITSSLLLWITLALSIRCACASSWLL